MVRPGERVSRISWIDGLVAVRQGDQELTVVVSPVGDGEPWEHDLPPDRTADLKVADGHYVRAGDELLFGILPDLREALHVLGHRRMARLFVDEAQLDLAFRRIQLLDRHLELIVRQMLVDERTLRGVSDLWSSLSP